MSTQEELKQIVVDGIAGGLSDDKIMENLYTDGGVEFKNIRKTFNTILSENKLRLGTKERNEEISKMMSTVTIKDGDHLKAIAESITKKMGCTPKQTMMGIRGYAGDNGVELPKPTRNTRGGDGFGKNDKIITDYIMQNKDCTFEELKAFASESIENNAKGKDVSLKFARNGWNIINFAKAFSA